MNSFRFLAAAPSSIEIRNARSSCIEDGLARWCRRRVLYDADTRRDPLLCGARKMRMDYRYFPDPDLLPLVISAGMDRAEYVATSMPELPEAKHGAALPARRRPGGCRCSADDATKPYDVQSDGGLFRVRHARCHSCQPKLAANWITGDVSAALNSNTDDRAIARLPGPGAATLAGLLKSHRRWHACPATTGRKPSVRGHVEWAKATTSTRIIEKPSGLKQVSDTGATRGHCRSACHGTPMLKSVEEFRAGKDKGLQRARGPGHEGVSKGKANPAQVNEVLKSKIG